ncbi:MAG: glycosyltransferase family 9 protein [Ignavibacteriaceae bacterium]
MTVTELSKIRKILIIRLSSLGDILLTTPFIRSLKKREPKLSIDVLIKEEYADALKLNNHLDNLYYFSKDERLNNNLLESLKLNSYDFVIDLQNNLRSRKITKTLNKNTSRFYKHSFDKFILVNFKISRLKSAETIPDRYAKTIEGFVLDNSSLDLFTDKFPDKTLAGKNNFIGFCPGARHFTKRWPKEYFIELGNKLSKEGFTILLFGGSIDKELCSEISKNIYGSIDLSNENDLLKTVADMKLCKTIVCNDSGLMHVASAVNTNVVAIFGSTVREFGFTPYNCKNLILENNSLTCRPCSHIGRNNCPKKHFNCMNSIKPEFVLKNILSFITNE